MDSNNPKNKEKRVVFTDTSIRHAELKIRLQHDGISQSDFFRAMITGYLEKDSQIINYMAIYKENMVSKIRKNEAVLLKTLRKANIFWKNLESKMTNLKAFLI